MRTGRRAAHRRIILGGKVATATFASARNTVASRIKMRHLVFWVIESPRVKQSALGLFDQAFG